jgi:hypothetical protein
LGRPFVRLDRLRFYDSYWSCGCRARTMDGGTVEIDWCKEHAEIFDNADLKLQA